MIRFKSGSGGRWPESVEPGPDSVVMVSSFPRHVGRQQSDKPAHSIVRPGRRLTIGPAALSDRAGEHIRQRADDSGDIMTTSVPAAPFTEPADAQRLERVAAALRAGNFAVEILDDAAAARARIKDLIPPGASVFTAASE